METPLDKRKSLDHKDRPWNWSDHEWREHCEKCIKLFGFLPALPIKPNPNDEAMVLLNRGWGISGCGAEVKYVRDMAPIDYQHINAYLPTINQMKTIYGKRTQCPTCGDHDCQGGLPCETGDGV